MRSWRAKISRWRSFLRSDFFGVVGQKMEVETYFPDGYGQSPPPTEKRGQGVERGVGVVGNIFGVDSRLPEYFGVLFGGIAV